MPHSFSAIRASVAPEAYPTDAAHNPDHPCAKPLVACCDGTGNEISENISNVLKLYRCLRKTDRTQLRPMASCAAIFQRSYSQAIDCRVKPGNDAGAIPGAAW